MWYPDVPIKTRTRDRRAHSRRVVLPSVRAAFSLRLAFYDANAITVYNMFVTVSNVPNDIGHVPCGENAKNDMESSDVCEE